MIHRLPVNLTHFLVSIWVLVVHTYMAVIRRVSQVTVQLGKVLGGNMDWHGGSVYTMRTLDRSANSRYRKVRTWMTMLGIQATKSMPRC